ncbi:uncharacterized protein TNCT_220921 [Trichonephila clavata]|uniref:Uncharacterized protein n=1 Tax=Trichonephila clavata TaxID=2740835 RepID=A0A8X6KRE5_TRICU|nr:uncharacterized protein TNCT_220921 [Trichonephila clavata]
MQLLLLVSVGVLFGSVACDAECFQKKSTECSEKMVKNAGSELEFSFCNFQVKLMKCLSNAAKECKMNFLPEAKMVDFVVDELCKSGSELNKDFLEHKECLMEAVLDVKCFQPVINTLKDKESEREIMLGQREACKQLDKISECVKKNVKKTCNYKAVSFFEFVFEPVVELHQGFCDEVIIPLTKNMKRSVSSELPNILGFLGFF